MSSEALTVRERNWLGDQGQAQIERKFDALLAEVARLEQELATVERVSQRNANAHMAVHRELAVAREREQEAWGTFRRFYDDVDKSQRIDNTGGDSAVAVTLWTWSEMRAALVDEPAAALGRQAVDDYRQDLASLAEAQTVASVGQPPAAATLAEPGEGGVEGDVPQVRGSGAAVQTSAENGATGQEVGLAAPGSASAAADEPTHDVSDPIWDEERDKYRVECSCGWEMSEWAEESARALARDHLVAAAADEPGETP